MMASPSSIASSSISAVVDSSSLSPQRNIKRKLEDAIHSLDEAVTSSPTTNDRPSPPKKLRTARSIYATLAKYGIKKDPKSSHTSDEWKDLTKTAPHLAAILSRSATRTRKALPFTHGHTSSSAASTSEYRPSSMQSFLSRLATFKQSTYSNKPPAIDAVAASKCGWINDGKDRLVCGICGVSWVLAGTQGMNRDAANTLVEKQRVSLVETHKAGCPWKARQCEASIYRLPLQAPLAMAKEIKARAIALDAILSGVQIKHPLTSIQVQSLTSMIASVDPILKPQTQDSQLEAQQPESISMAPHAASAPSSEPSETALLTALFGWSVLPPAPPTERVRASSSVSRAGSVAPSTPIQSLSRSPSTATLRDSTPTPSGSRAPARSRTSLVGSTSHASSFAKPATTLLHCALCQRRIGLWAFLPPLQTNGRSVSPEAEAHQSAGAKVLPQRQLNILGEHRSYCPYIVRSSIVPSMPAPPVGQKASESQVSLANASTASLSGQPGAIEGWRAALAVVLRHGMVRRQRLGLTRISSERSGREGEEQESPVERDPVEAMVTGVKARGGKDLLRYVKGLLG